MTDPRIEAAARIAHDEFWGGGYDEDDEDARHQARRIAQRILALDAVDDGWEPVTIDADERPKTATLLFALIVPDGEPPEGIDHASLADMMADEFAEIINEERRANGGSAGDVLVSGIPMPQFLTSNTMARYKAADAVLSGKEVRVRRSVTPSEAP